MKEIKKGSFTAEASLILPFLLMIITIMLLLAMYLHDRSVLLSNASETAGKGTVLKYQQNRQLKQHLLREAEQLTGGKLLAAKDFQVWVEVTDQEIQVSYEARTDFLGGIPIRVSASAERARPVVFIRTYRNLRELVPE